MCLDRMAELKTQAHKDKPSRTQPARFCNLELNVVIGGRLVVGGCDAVPVSWIQKMVVVMCCAASIPSYLAPDPNQVPVWLHKELTNPALMMLSTTQPHPFTYTGRSSRFLPRIRSFMWRGCGAFQQRLLFLIAESVYLTSTYTKTSSLT